MLWSSITEPVTVSNSISIFTIFFLSYLVGSIPFGLLITKLLKMGNLRKFGSGNIGATNVLRMGGKKAALATLILDGGKGFLIVKASAVIFGDPLSLVAAVGVFIGHLYSIYIKLKGGKGVATFLGIMLATNFIVGALACLSWIFVAALFRISSLSALLSSGFSLIFLLLIGNMLKFGFIVPSNNDELVESEIK